MTTSKSRSATTQWRNWAFINNKLNNVAQYPCAPGDTIIKTVTRNHANTKFDWLYGHLTAISTIGCFRMQNYLWHLKTALPTTLFLSYNLKILQISLTIQQMMWLLKDVGQYLLIPLINLMMVMTIRNCLKYQDST